VAAQGVAEPDGRAPATPARTTALAGRHRPRNGRRNREVSARPLAGVPGKRGVAGIRGELRVLRRVTLSSTWTTSPVCGRRNA
jgi:hypothetical protein